MNAVAAVFGAADPQAARGVVTQLLDRMPKRAAGHRTIVADDGGVIGASGSSPAFASKADCALLAGDLRLDNADELRQTLSLAADAAPAVIVVEAYARWGDTFAARLAGDFALVLLDRPGRRLLAVRDPLGIRPLYYRTGTAHLRCASELRALIEPGDAADEGFLAEALAGDIVDTEGTPYLSVRRLPAGHILIASSAGERIVRYWEPPAEQRSGLRAEYAERFRAAFDEGVRARCAGHARVGVWLSGGLDSASLAGTICALRCADPIAGSLRFPWPEADEGDRIAATLRRWTMESIPVMPPMDPPPHDLDAVRWTAHLPEGPTGFPMQAPLQHAMKAAGAEVVLTGCGGGQFWSGVAAHMSDLLRRGRLGELRRWREAADVSGERTRWSWSTFAREAVLPLVPALLRRSARHLVPDPLPPWIDLQFAGRVELRDRLRRHTPAADAPNESWRRLLWRLDSGEDALAKERLDRLAAATGLELRHPFYDRRLVEAAFEMPQEAHFDGTRHRAAQRDAMATRLAPELSTNLATADLSRVLVEGARASDVKPFLRFDALAGLRWIDPEKTADLARRAIDEGNGEAAASLWRIMAVEAWLRERYGTA